MGFFVYLLIYLRDKRFNSGSFFLTFAAFLSSLGNVATGVTLSYLNFPAIAQPLHLVFGVFTLGLLYSLSLNLRGTLLSD
jgi:hypothetical protein